MENKLVANHTTWCNSSVQAAVNLANMLNEYGDRRYINRVNKLMTQFDIRMASLIQLRDVKDRRYFAKVHFVETTTVVYQTDFLPLIVRTHILNVMKTKHKEFIKNYGTSVKN